MSPQQKFARHTQVGDPDPRTLVSTTTVSGNDCVGFLYGVSCTLLALVLVNVLHSTYVSVV